jgi:demethylmenaquinone methyltransferase/2-methoxy-6-polyprenyl-1,4-benzoquinol methylase
MSLALDRRWRRIALDLARRRPRSVLDLACGTGDSTLAIVRKFPHARVAGVDFTPEMTAIAQTKTGNRPGIGFYTADAADLGRFRDHEFQLVFCAFGFRNFPDKAKVLDECRRVLDSGGELVVLELFRPGSRIPGRLVSAWIAVCSALFARRQSREYAYLRRSMAATLDAGEFVRLAESRGFALAGRKNLFPSATALCFRPE